MTKVTARLIQCHCFLFDKKLSDLGVDTSDEKVRYSFLKEEVIEIREVIEKSGDTEPAPDKCCIYFKNGNSTWIDMSYEEALKNIFDIDPEKD